MWKSPFKKFQGIWSAKSKISEGCLHKFYLVHSWIPWTMYWTEDTVGQKCFTERILILSLQLYWKNGLQKGCFPKKLLKIFLKCKFLRTLTKLGYTLKLFNFLVVWFATSKAELNNKGQKIHKSRSRFLWLKVQSWKLYNNENMTVSARITNTEIFAFVAFAVFKLLGHKFCL